MSKSEQPAAVPSNRFRPTYRQLDHQELHKMEQLKSKAEELAVLIEAVRPIPTRYTSLALTNLEQSVMWAVKELTA